MNREDNEHAEERRTDWVRVPVRLSGAYRRIDPDVQQWRPTKSADLSAGGAAIECHRGALNVDDIVLVRFEESAHLGLPPMQFRAVVRNARADGRTYGLAWTRLTASQEEDLIHAVLQLQRELTLSRSAPPPEPTTDSGVDRRPLSS